MYDIPNCGMVRKTGIFHGVGERRNHRIWDTQFSVPYDISSVWCLYIALAYHIWNLNISIYLDKLLLTCAWFDLLSADMIFVSLIYTYIYIYVSICIYPYLSAWSFRYSKVGELLDLYMRFRKKGDGPKLYTMAAEMHVVFSSVFITLITFLMLIKHHGSSRRGWVLRIPHADMALESSTGGKLLERWAWGCLTRETSKTLAGN